MMQSDNNVLSAYDITDLMFKSRFSKLTIPTIEFATNHWTKQITLRKCLCIKKHLKLDKKAHNQTCDICDWKVLSFTGNSKYVNEYQETLKLFLIYYSINPEKDESKISIDPIVVSKDNDSPILSQQPINHNVLMQNPPLKKEKEKRFTQRIYNN